MGQINAFLLICSVCLWLHDQPQRYWEVASETTHLSNWLVIRVWLWLNCMKFAKFRKAAGIPLLKRLWKGVECRCWSWVIKSNPASPTSHLGTLRDPSWSQSLHLWGRDESVSLTGTLWVQSVTHSMPSITVSSYPSPFPSQTANS